MSRVQVWSTQPTPWIETRNFSAHILDRTESCILKTKWRLIIFLHEETISKIKFSFLFMLSIDFFDYRIKKKKVVEKRTGFCDIPILVKASFLRSFPVFLPFSQLFNFVLLVYFIFFLSSFFILFVLTSPSTNICYKNKTWALMDNE